MPLGIDPTVDYAFKKLFADPANKDLLLHLLNAVLPPPVIVEVEILNPFNEKDFADDKLSVLDIKARCASGVWYNVEIQSKAHWSLPARLAYYNACLFVDQLADGEKYAELTPAITICFLKDVVFRTRETPHMRFAFYDGQNQLELTDRLQIHTIELPKYNFQKVPLAAAETLTQWAYFLSNAAELEAEELRQVLPQREFVKATGVVEMIAKTPQERMQYEARRKAERDFQSFVADARLEGEAIGEAIGEARGVSQGRQTEIARQVQFLRGLLGETVESTEELLAMIPAQLEQLRESLQIRVQNRP